MDTGYNEGNDEGNEEGNDKEGKALGHWRHEPEEIPAPPPLRRLNDSDELLPEVHMPSPLGVESDSGEIQSEGVLPPPSWSADAQPEQPILVGGMIDSDEAPIRSPEELAHLEQGDAHLGQAHLPFSEEPEEDFPEFSFSLEHMVESETDSQFPVQHHMFTLLRNSCDEATRKEFIDFKRLLYMTYGILAARSRSEGGLSLADEDLQKSSPCKEVFDIAVRFFFYVFLCNEGIVRVCDLLDYTNEVRDTLMHSQTWPFHSVVSVPVPPVLYYEHPEEGRLRLQWVDPVDLVIGGLRCDVCQKSWLLSAFRTVSVGGEHDYSSFHEHRIGWDLCLSCGEAYQLGEMKKLEDFLSIVCEKYKLDGMCTAGEEQAVAFMMHSIYRSHLYEDYVLRLCESPCAKDNHLDLKLEVTQCGETLLCTELSDMRKLPSAWTGFRMRLDADCLNGEDCRICLEGLHDTSEGRIRPVLTSCGHWFHEQCLRKHLRGHEGQRGRCCPLCRCENPSILSGCSSAGAIRVVEISLAFEQYWPEAVAVAIVADPDLPLQSYAVFSLVVLPPRTSLVSTL